ncbi:glycoside hydrolase [Fomitiporia mediterranea MF3/22]|uniref:glycoside hydrolase n=1 Tax=Fomitiporia mediterranea (strain MF3/22) TaxID=694068 RepID=UPI00044072B2|nr:glycoside hydrolase [Fomitiporia mediterranea MF3/22]EJD06242.1 glycoside hydrolase [Fomitiporia mediterranea MF3/22]
MPRIPPVSPATEKPTKSFYIHTLDGNFVDNSGRTLLLRGVNLSGSSKAPVGEPSYLRDELWESGESGNGSFIGRPLSLEDGSADVHLARLKGWGFNVLRYPIAWEALEHEGPGKYDYEFMDYTIRVLRKCKEYGFKVYIDPHQDAWSRFSGGSGAPYWTLLACGMNPRNFTATQAAILHSEYPVAHKPKPESLPAMIWGTNYGRLVSQTIFTLFFAGKDYAPKCIIDGQNIQDYLQSHFIAAFGALADRIRDAGDLLDECVIGWDSINEPGEGFCGYDDLNAVPEEQGSTLRKGSRPTPAQSLRLGMGQVQTVEHWTFGAFGPKCDGMVTVDPKGHKIWLDPDAEDNGINRRWGWKRDPGWKLGVCIWAQHGVWDVESGYILQPEYFRCPPFDPERPVVFEADYWRPHWRAYSARIRAAHPETIHFLHPPVFAEPPPLDGPDDLCGRCCYSAHYYDGLTLVTRHWNWFNADALGVLRGKYKATWMAAKIGERAIRKSLQEQLGILRKDAEILGAYPTMIGEIGTPFDMDGKRSYGWTDGGKYAGDYSSQQKALDASLNAADGPNGLNYSIWTYCPDSCHEWGDLWNMEDLSLWSEDDLQPVPNSSGYRMRNADSSEVGLLRKKTTDTIVRVRQVASAVPSATASAVSLVTLGGASIAASTDDEYDRDMKSRQAVDTLSSRPHWANQYDFLTDGARAVRAFARPYPAAVVGLSTNISFDIHKAEFKLTVKVRPEDRPVVNSEPSSSGSSSSGEDELDKERFSELPTEIFVPLVHYARQDIVSRSLIASLQNENSTDQDSESPSDGIEDLGSMTPASLMSSQTLPMSSLLDVDVRVSSGKWRVEGQYLRWWYSIPQEGEPDLEHTIQITRSGGPIRTKAELPSTSQCNSGSGGSGSGLWNFCERLCERDGDGKCCIM